MIVSADQTIQQEVNWAATRCILSIISERRIAFLFRDTVCSQVINFLFCSFSLLLLLLSISFPFLTSNFLLLSFPCCAVILPPTFLLCNVGRKLKISNLRNVDSRAASIEVLRLPGASTTRSRTVQFVQIRKFRYSWWSFGRKSDTVG